MTQPDDEPWRLPGEAFLRRLFNRKEEPSEFEDLQDRIRKGGYRQNPDGSYETNEGKVYLESPHEAGRRAIYAKSADTRRDYFYKGVRDPATEQAAKALAHDKELDIDWGIYAPQEEDRPVLHYGICIGGPYAGRPVAHHQTVMEVMIDVASGRATPGLQAPSLAYPEIVTKAYVWQPALEQWQWDDSVRSRETLQRD